jgi:hypothetical protein
MRREAMLMTLRSHHPVQTQLQPECDQPGRPSSDHHGAQKVESFVLRCAEAI